MQYYPTPPAEPRGRPEQPAARRPNSVWSPGYWDWQGDRYVWRPGFWVAFQPDWVWVPAHYVWTPSGCLFVDGYWDLPVARRGTPFAPVYFAQPVYRQPQFVYTPTIGLVASALADEPLRPAELQPVLLRPKSTLPEFKEPTAGQPQVDAVVQLLVAAVGATVVVDPGAILPL